MLNRRELMIGAGAASLLGACGGDDGPAPPRNAYRQSNLAASDADSATFGPTLADTERDAEFINAWGIAIRPAGAGGHFWVGAGGYSFEFVGDVTAASDGALRTLFQDALTLVRVPGAGVPDGEPEVGNADKFIGFTTGVAFNGTALDSGRFVVRGQSVTVDGAELTLDGAARFLFATDSGVISGWTECNAAEGGIVRRNGAAVPLINGAADGHAYFGIAIKTGTWGRLWAADFGADPQIRGWDSSLAPIDLVAAGAFRNPFIGARPKAEPGDYVPFNIQVLTWQGSEYAVVAYARSQPDPADATKFFAAEEDAIAKADEGDRPDRGKAAMFDLNGALVKTFADDGRLNGERGTFIEYLRAPAGERVEIEGLWGLQFGNGASLGDADALYFAAGPGDETQGLFGSLRATAA